MRIDNYIDKHNQLSESHIVFDMNDQTSVFQMLMIMENIIKRPDYYKTSESFLSFYLKVLKMYNSMEKPN